MVRVYAMMTTLLMAGCLDGEEPSNNKDNSLSTTRFSATSGSNGIASLEVDVDNNVDVFSIYASSNQYISVETIIDPDGNTVLDWADWKYSFKSKFLDHSSRSLNSFGILS